MPNNIAQLLSLGKKSRSAGKRPDDYNRKKKTNRKIKKESRKTNRG